jgi:SNF2 family DNA or RNA helicase
MLNDEIYARLRKVRESKTVKLKPSEFMKTTIESLDGSEIPFDLRYYQAQGAFHMIALKRMVLGDDTGLGKTVETLAALSHIYSANAQAKAIIVTPKSTVHQWASEINRFTNGIRPIVVETKAKKGKTTPLEDRKALYQDWATATDRVILILNYSLLVRDWDADGFVPVLPNGRPDPKKPVVPGILNQAALDAGDRLISILDEAQNFKNMKTKTWERVRYLCDMSDRAYGLTATLLGSNLMEGYCIYKAIHPKLFPAKTKFMAFYCHVELQAIPGKRQKFPIIVGYKNLDVFRETIDPYFLGRKKQEVSDELPVLISKNIDCELSEAEDRKYVEALSGVLALGDGDIRDYEETKALVSLLYCQQVVDSLALLKFEDGDSVGQTYDETFWEAKEVVVGTLGAKEQALVDLVSDEGELQGEKVIIYTRFAKLVPRLQKILAKRKVQSVCITGDAQFNKFCLDEVGIKGIKAPEVRQAAQKAFQDGKSGVQVMIITNAGGVGINLQMARALIFYDLPWTWGDYVQTLGRMIRIGSPHRGVAVYHLFAKRPSTAGNRKTIDHHVYTLLRKKQTLIDKVLGEAAAGALDFDKDSGSAMDIIRAMREDK